ncbi:MAG TPA: hypothetical protein VME66_11260 [Candidatus Acidoferrales bacterium]|nr:hypothetical protein [Candidatus Acidoferrales bacterium]
MKRAALLFASLALAAVIGAGVAAAQQQTFYSAHAGATGRPTSSPNAPAINVDVYYNGGCGPQSSNRHGSHSKRPCTTARRNGRHTNQPTPMPSRHPSRHPSPHPSPHPSHRPVLKPSYRPYPRSTP